MRVPAVPNKTDIQGICPTSVQSLAIQLTVLRYRKSLPATYPTPIH